MLDWFKAKLHKLPNPLSILSTRENVIIIQIYPKRHAIAVSHKRRTKTAYIDDNSIKNMMRGGLAFDQNSYTVLKAAATLLKQIINEQ